MPMCRHICRSFMLDEWHPSRNCIGPKFLKYFIPIMSAPPLPWCKVLIPFIHHVCYLVQLPLNVMRWTYDIFSMLITLPKWFMEMWILHTCVPFQESTYLIANQEQHAITTDDTKRCSIISIRVMFIKRSRNFDHS